MTGEEERILFELLAMIASTPEVKRHLRRLRGVCPLCADKGSVTWAERTWPCPRCNKSEFFAPARQGAGT